MKKLTVVFRDEELYQAIKARASFEERTLQSVITEALDQWLQDREDAEDAALGARAMDEPGASVPWQQVRDEMRNYG